METQLLHAYQNTIVLRVCFIGRCVLLAMRRLPEKSMFVPLEFSEYGPLSINNDVSFSYLYFFFLKKILLIYFLERGGRTKKERERNINVWLPLACPLLRIWPTTQACALTGNRTSSPLISRLAFNPLSHTNMGDISFM